MRAGDVVLMRYPFSDLSGSKVRPAVVLAAAGGSDFIVCPMTRSAADPNAVRVEQQDFRKGSLNAGGHARPGKLFTASRSLVTGRVGYLKRPMVARLQTAASYLILNG